MINIVVSLSVLVPACGVGKEGRFLFSKQESSVVYASIFKPSKREEGLINMSEKATFSTL